MVSPVIESITSRSLFSFGSNSITDIFFPMNAYKFFETSILGNSDFELVLIVLHDIKKMKIPNVKIV
jgi:hypothetical protein